MNIQIDQNSKGFYRAKRITDDGERRTKKCYRELIDLLNYIRDCYKKGISVDYSRLEEEKRKTIEDVLK